MHTNATFEPASPKSMKNSIWSRPEVKKTSKNWAYRSHKQNKLTKIAIITKTAKGFEFMGDTMDNFGLVKDKARDAGYNMVRMGAVKVAL